MGVGGKWPKNHVGPFSHCFFFSQIHLFWSRPKIPSTFQNFAQNAHENVVFAPLIYPLKPKLVTELAPFWVNTCN